MVATAALMFSSCSSAGFKDVYTARDSEGRMKTTMFKDKDTEIHIIGELVSGREDVIVTMKLVAPPGTVSLGESEIAPGKGENKIDVKLRIEIPKENTGGGEGTTGGDDTTKQFSEKGPWPKGDYEATFYIDGSKEESVKFKVVASE